MAPTKEIDLSSKFAQVQSLEIDGIRRVFEHVDPASVKKVVDRIVSCSGTVLTSGAGTSGILARKVAHTLCCVGKPALFLSPVDAVHGGSGMVRSDDIAIFFSKGGETEELKSLLVPLFYKKVDTILVTETSDSTLGKACAIVLQMPSVVEIDPNDVIATASITATSVFFDAISLCVLEYTGYTLDDFAPTHPGGAVGKQLLPGEPGGKTGAGGN